MTVCSLRENQTGVISDIVGCGTMSMRLMTIGFIPGKDITILQKGKRSSLVKIGNMKVALSSSLLNNIEIV